MKSRIFEYAVVWYPTEKEVDDDGKKAEMVVDVTRVLAKDESHVAILAAKSIPTEWEDRLDQCEVAIRPF